MSAADDQRAAAAAEILRRYLTDPGRCDHPTDGELASLLAGLDRLRAELAETRAKVASHEADLDLTINRLHNFGQVGDALAEAAVVIDEHWQDDCVTREQVECLLRAAQAWRSVRGDAPAEPPAVELPVTLSSPDDVAAVCLAHGLTVRSSGPGWTQWRDPDTKVVVHCEAWQSGVERVTVAGRDRADIYRPVARGTLVAAIKGAARGGSR